MALSKALNGLVPSRKLGSDDNNLGLTSYKIANATAGAIFNGDLVKVSAGYLRTVSATTDYAIGVFRGCEWIDPTTKKKTFSNYFPASTSSAVGNPIGFVVDDSKASFIVQADATVSALDVMSANYTVTIGAGSTVTGNSGFGLKVAGRTAAAAMLRVVGVADVPGNALGDANAKVEVQIVTHQMNRVSAS